MAVYQLEPAVGKLVGKQAAGEADLLVERFQSGALVGGVRAEVELVRDEVAGANAAVGLDAVANCGGHDLPPHLSRNQRSGYQISGGGLPSGLAAGGAPGGRGRPAMRR